MTSGLASAAVASVMLLHAVFGCCWHHSHGECARNDRTTADGHARGHQECGGHHKCGGHRHGDVPPPHVHFGDEPAENHDHDDCSGDFCRFLSSAPVELPAADGLSWAVPAVDAASAIAVAFCAVSAARSDGLSDAAASASRLRPLLCVWRL